MIDIVHGLEYFGRGGGGGSSGGGDGGGIIGAIGYFIGFYVTKIIKKITGEETAKILSAIVMALLTFSFVLLIVFVGSFVAGYVLVLIIVGLWAGWYAQMNNLWARFRGKIKKADADLADAAQKDSVWDEQKLHALARSIFMRYQGDWTRLDTSKLSEYATTRYTNKVSLMLKMLRDLNRQNAVIDPQIIKIDTINVQDSQDDSQDFFTVMIEAQAKDMLIDMGSNKTIFQDNKSFIEFWSFQRSESTWLLSDIEQSTAKQLSSDTTLQELAKQQGMFYSLDMGWLFLPSRGQVFHNGMFGISDINNHLVGLVNGILTQMYTYNSYYNNDSKNYVIGQITVPKSYGSILVRPKQKLLTLDSSNNIKEPTGSQKYDFEWPDFNRKFEVFATDADRLASFELINPKFMEMMYAIDESLVLEVTDNIIFFRVSQKTSLETYAQLLGLLKQAYKELKL